MNSPPIYPVNPPPPEPRAIYLSELQADAWLAVLESIPDDTEPEQPEPKQPRAGRRRRAQLLTKETMQ